MEVLRKMTVVLVVASGCSFYETKNGANREAEVTFYVAGQQGDALPYEVQAFVDRRSGESLHGRFGGGLAAKHIPFGSYSYTLVHKRARTPRASTITGTAEIWRRRVWITTQPVGVVTVAPSGEEFTAQFGPEHFQSLEGKLYQWPPLAMPTWVRLHAFPTGGFVDAPVDKNGHFDFPPLEPGWYVLLVVSRGTPMQTDILRIDNNPRTRVISILYRPSDNR